MSERIELRYGGRIKMENIIWLIIMIPVSLLFTGIGISKHGNAKKRCGSGQEVW